MKSARDDWKLIQEILGTRQDGIPGKNDESALELLRNAAMAEYREANTAKPAPVSITPPPAPEPIGIDERSAKNIATLIPQAQEQARIFLRKLNAELVGKGVVAKIISGHRSYEEQDELYAQGRAKRGEIVTNAKGGFSDHNFGVAWDIGIFQGDKYLPESRHYATGAHIGRVMGLDVGADWRTFPDEPHFGIKTGYTLAQMRERKAKGLPILA